MLTLQREDQPKPRNAGASRSWKRQKTGPPTPSLQKEFSRANTLTLAQGHGFKKFDLFKNFLRKQIYVVSSHFVVISDSSHRKLTVPGNTGQSPRASVQSRVHMWKEAAQGRDMRVSAWYAQKCDYTHMQV